MSHESQSRTNESYSVVKKNASKFENGSAFM